MRKRYVTEGDRLVVCNLLRNVHHRNMKFHDLCKCSSCSTAFLLRLWTL
jgi:hypothetical protein